MASAWPTLANTMEMLTGLFSFEVGGPLAADSGDRGCLEDIRRALVLAEERGVESEALETIRQRLEEVAREAQKDLAVTVRHAASGEVVAVVRARPTDTTASLREGVLRETGDALVALRFVFGERVLGDYETLDDAGICDGDTVLVVRSALRCLTASFDGTSRICRLYGGAVDDAAPSAFREHGPVLSAALSPCGASVLVVCSGGDGTLRCTTTGALECQLSGWASTAEFSPDGRLVVGASDRGSARVWCARTGRCLHVLSGHTDDVKNASFSRDCQLVATASCDGTAAIWDASSGRRLLELSGHRDVVRSAVFSPDSQQVLTTSMDATARIWNGATGDCIQVLQGHAKALSGAQFSPDGRRALTASFDGTVRLWEARTGECTHTLPAENNVVNAAAFSPDGELVLVASASESLRLFSASTGECKLTLSGHEDWVRAATFSPDGMLVASGSYDGTARIWSSLDGHCLKTLTGHTGAVVVATIAAG